MTQTNPTWWTAKHASAWDRVKDALKRDWEQTKSDFSSKGQDLNQNVGDTVKQAVGAEKIPPGTQANVKTGTVTADWKHAEDSYRFGAGARYQYAAKHPVWSDELDRQLQTDWKSRDNSISSWTEARAHVRRAYERSGN